MDTMWEDVRTGNGDEYDFGQGPLIGAYLGAGTLQVPDKEAESGVRDQTIYRFELIDGSIAMVWGGYQLDLAFDPAADQLISPGDVVRIVDQGTHAIRGGKQQLHSYRVQVAPVGMSLADAVAHEVESRAAVELPGERLTKAHK